MTIMAVFKDKENVASNPSPYFSTYFYVYDEDNNTYCNEVFPKFIDVLTKYAGSSLKFGKIPKNVEFLVGEHGFKTKKIKRFKDMKQFMELFADKLI